MQQKRGDDADDVQLVVTVINTILEVGRSSKVVVDCHHVHTEGQAQLHFERVCRHRVVLGVQLPEDEVVDTTGFKRDLLDHLIDVLLDGCLLLIGRLFCIIGVRVLIILQPVYGVLKSRDELICTLKTVKVCGLPFAQLEFSLFLLSLGRFLCLNWVRDFLNDLIFIITLLLGLDHLLELALEGRVTGIRVILLEPLQRVAVRVSTELAHQGAMLVLGHNELKWDGRDREPEHEDGEFNPQTDDAANASQLVIAHIGLKRDFLQGNEYGDGNDKSQHAQKYGSLAHVAPEVALLAIFDELFVRVRQDTQEGEASVFRTSILLFLRIFLVLLFAAFLDRVLKRVDPTHQK